MRIHGFVAGVVIALLMAVPVGLIAQRAGAKLTAEQILDRASQSEAPPAARARIKTMHLKGQINIPAQGIRGNLEIYWKSPNKLLLVQTVAGVGEIRQGFDGKVGWEKNPLTGLRRLQGAELEQLKYTSDNTTTARWRQFVRSPKLRGTQKVDNFETYVISATTLYGTAITFYIDTKQFLTRRIDMEVLMQGGKVPTIQFFEDYRRINGIHYPFRIRQQVVGIETTLTVQQVRHNAPLRDSLFQMPKE
ncbi:MAG: hypothetical protein NZL85_05435 [Fimbriimonadales bacterium]|nr:hypothetical protein [Fimbriimonadales bacterium]